MARLVITGGRKLKGTIQVEGAKNAVLPIMAASLLTTEEVELNNIPNVEDIRVMAELVKSTGAKIEIEGKTLYVDATNLHGRKLPRRLAGKIRSSLQMIGALLPRLGSIEVSLPGGDHIGTRGIDLHLMGLTALGATIDVAGESIRAQTNGLKGADFALRFPSVGATENIMIAACQAKGTTVIRNAAREPEVADLANFLNSMGARIEGAGSDTITMAGVKKLNGTKYTVIPDRINTGTYVVAAAITHGNILIRNADLSHLETVIMKLRQTGVEVMETPQGIEVSAQDRFQPVDIVTEVYPGFITDMQPIITSLLALAQGRSTVKETIFDNRFAYTPELRKMGADIEVRGDATVIRGVKKLTGARVTATDIRGGAALVVAGLAAQGETVINNVYEIDRGYDDIEGKLRGLGAQIWRTE